MSGKKLNVKKSVVVISVKGGVSKSTISAGLAIKLKELMPVILIDGDIASPNLGEMLKVNEELQEIGVNKRNVVSIEDNLDFFSMSLIAKDSLVSMKAIQYANLLSDIILYSKFNVPKEKSCLVVDTEAGVSDTHRALFELLAESLVGTIITTLPSCPDDCRRAVKFCQKYGVPVLAIVESMSYFQCECGRKYYIFGKPKAKKIAEEIGASYFQLPIIPDMQEYVELGFMELPPELDAVCTELARIVFEAKPATESILSKIKRKVIKVTREQLIKAIAPAIKVALHKINTEFDLKYWVDKGYGGSTINIILNNEGTKLISVCFTLDRRDAKFKLIRAVENPDITVIIEGLHVIKSIAETKTPEEAYKVAKELILSGDIIVIGDKAMLKSMEFIEKIAPIIANEAYAKLKPIIAGLF